MFRNFFKYQKSNKKNLIGCKFFFRPQLLNESTIQSWIKNDIKQFIEPISIEERIQYDQSYYQNLSLGDLKKKPISVSIYGHDLGRGKVRDTEHFWINSSQQIKNIKFDFLSVYTRFIYDSQKLNFETFIREKSFICGFIYDYDYVFEQSMRNIEWFKSLRGKKIVKDKWGQKWIDISNNPGRITHTLDYTYCGAAKMYFGPEFFQSFSVKKFLTFDDFIELKKLDEDLIFVQLYRDIFNSEAKENQLKQKKFRSFLEIDKKDIKEIQKHW